MEQGLSSIIDRHAPKIRKCVKDRKCPWLTYKIKTLMNTRNKVLKKAGKIKKSVNGSLIEGLKTYATIKSNKLSRNIKKTCYSRIGINLLSFGTAQINFSFKRICTYLCNHKHQQCKKHQECKLDLYFLYKHRRKLKI